MELNWFMLGLLVLIFSQVLLLVFRLERVEDKIDSLFPKEQQCEKEETK